MRRFSCTAILGAVILAVVVSAPVKCQIAERQKSDFFRGMPNVCIVDDNDPGFSHTGDYSSTSDYPVADGRCAARSSSGTLRWLRAPLRLRQTPSTEVHEGSPFGDTITWSAQYRSDAKYCLSEDTSTSTEVAFQTQGYHNTGTWAPDLTGAGLGTGCYEIWVYLPWNSTAVAPYTVSDAFHSPSAVIRVRQYGEDRCSARNKWVRLDAPANETYWKFNLNTAGQGVTLDDKTDEEDSAHPCGLSCIVFDAVAFVRAEEARLVIRTFIDNNPKNGVLDPGEKLIGDRDVTIYDGVNSTGPVVGTVHTDATGVCTYFGGQTLAFRHHYCAQDKQGDFPASPVTLDSCTEAIDVPVCLGSITVSKFNDCDMDGIQETGEDGIVGWPVTLTHIVEGKAVETIDAFTGPGGVCKFADLDPGTYTISEQSATLPWGRTTRICGGQTWCDWQTTKPFLGKKWQLTSIRINGSPITDFCSLAAPEATVQVACDDQKVTFGNVPLSTVTAFKFHDLNMNERFEPAGETYTDTQNDHKWTPEEPYSDTNCNGIHDPNEFYYDRNKNEQWDPAEPFVDADGDGVYDYPECVIANWPIKLSGLRADGKPVCIDGGNTRTTDANGNVVFEDVPPSDKIGYTLSEDVQWCAVDLPGERVHRATYDQATMSCAYPPCKVTRWQAVGDSTNDHDIRRTFTLGCDETHHEDFANICLSSVAVAKLVYEGGAIVESDKKPGEHWEITMAGTDPRGLDVVPSLAPCKPIASQAQPPIQMPCRQYSWYSVWTDSAGNATFYDLLPGHYHLMEQPYPGYRVAIDKPSMCGFDILCCDQAFTISNMRLGVPIKVYQAYAGSSDGADPITRGYAGNSGDAITAAPGVLSIEPGKNWVNFKQGAQLCRDTPPKTTTFTKTFSPFAQCADVFGPISIVQHGTPSIRTWWPLMYEPPSTTWTLKLLYGTNELVQLPGETKPGWVHLDEWKWSVDTDIPHMKLYLDLLHEVPFGNDEVPLISDEPLLAQLKAKLNAAQAALSGGDTAKAGLLLGEFELEVMDACIDSSPQFPNVTGPGTGIANSKENPACCKLLIDTEYVGKTVGAFQQKR